MGEAVVAGICSRQGQGGGNGFAGGDVLVGEGSATAYAYGVACEDADKGLTGDCCRCGGVINLALGNSAGSGQGCRSDVRRRGGGGVEGVVAGVDPCESDAVYADRLPCADVLVVECGATVCERQCIAAKAVVAEAYSGRGRGVINFVLSCGGNGQRSSADVSRGGCGGVGQRVVARIGATQCDAADANGLTGSHVLVVEGASGGADGEAVSRNHVGKGRTGCGECSIRCGVIGFVVRRDTGDVGDRCPGDVSRRGSGTEVIIARVRSRQRDAADVDGLGDSSVLVIEAAGRSPQVDNVARNHSAERTAGQGGDRRCVIDLAVRRQAGDAEAGLGNVGGRARRGSETVVTGVGAAEREATDTDGFGNADILVIEGARRSRQADGIARNHTGERTAGQGGDRRCVIDLVVCG